MTKTALPASRRRALLSVLAVLALPAIAGPASAGDASSGVPVRFTLDRPGYVTLVAEHPDGTRAVDLLRETRLPAGEHQVWWDGYLNPTVDRNDRATAVKAPPGTYRIHGLVHDGLALRYEFPVYSPGSPAWFTRDDSGAWLSDHAPPAAALWLPQGIRRPDMAPDAAGPAMLIGSNVAEAGHALMWLRPDGTKIYGMKIDGWMGAKALARDLGDRALERHAAYAVHINNSGGATAVEDGKRGALSLFALGADGAPEFIYRFFTDRVVPFDGYRCPVGAAAWNGVVVFSNPMDHALVVVDAAEKKLLGTIPLPSPRGVAFAPDGRLWAITDGQVKSHAFDARTPALSDERVEVAGPFENPRQLALLDGGGVLVSDWGGAHQVKRFDAGGRPVGVIGAPGGMQIGLYDEERMQHPNGIAVSPDGTVWVCEDEFLPKRISRWTLDGAFLDAWYGGPQYGGGGRPDPRDPTRFYYASGFNFGSIGGLEFELDWETGASRLKSIYYRGPDYNEDDAIHPEVLNPETTHILGWDRFPMVSAPDAARYVGDRLYLISSWQSGERHNDMAFGVWRMDDDRIARPVGIVFGGTVWEWRRFFEHRPELMACLPEPHNADQVFRHLFAWSDLNGDGRWQADEITAHAFDVQDADGRTIPLSHLTNIRPGPNLSFSAPAGLFGPEPEIRPDGVPVWDLARVEPRLPYDEHKMSGPIWDLRAGQEEVGDGWVVSPGMLLWPNLFAWKDGKPAWSYYSRLGTTLPRRPGDVIEAIRLLGPPATPVAGEAGPVLAWNGERGTIYLFTRDGLFLRTLAGDMRQAPMLREPSVERGADLLGVSFEDEHFHPTFQQLEDGDIFFVCGKEFSALWRLDGLETVQRFNAPDLDLSPDALADLPDERVDEPRVTAGRNRLTIFRLDAEEEKAFAAGTDAWTSRLPASAWAVLDERGRAAAVLGEKTMYLCFRTGDPDFPRNTGREFQYLFKNGDAYDLMLRPHFSSRPTADVAEGDLRLLVTRTPDADNHPATRATLFRPVVPGTTDGEKVRFTSPVGAVSFDRVEDVSDEVVLRRSSNGDALIAIPLDLLGLDRDRRRAGIDLGLLRGDGRQTVRRLYWNNADTTVVSDIPSEARLAPDRWGEGVIRGRVSNAGEITLLPETATMFGGHQVMSSDHRESPIAWWGSPTGGARWNFNVPATGHYRVVVEHGSGHGDAFTIALRQPPEAEPVALRGVTGQTRNWDEVTEVEMTGTVALSAGAARLEIAPAVPTLNGRDFIALARIRLIPTNAE